MSPRSVFVTGATRGLGFGIVKYMTELKEPPKFVFATYRNVEGAKDLFEFAEKNKSVRPIQLDVRDTESYERVVDEVASVVGNFGLNCLVNNAGIAIISSITSVTKQEILDMLEVNAIPHLLLTRAFLPLLRKGYESSSGTPFTWSRAAVVNISNNLASITECTEELISIYPERIHTVHSYRITTAAQNMVTRLLSLDVKADNILVVGINPGWLQTDMGGMDGTFPPIEAASNVFSVVEKLTKAETGTFLNYDGKPIEY